MASEIRVHKITHTAGVGTSIKYAISVCKINQSGTVTFYFGRSTNDTDTADYERLPCNITVMEVSA